MIDEPDPYLAPTEELCSVCSRWPAADREGMRMLIDTLPLREPVCLKCWGALAINCGWITEPTEH